VLTRPSIRFRRADAGEAALPLIDRGPGRAHVVGHADPRDTEEETMAERARLVVVGAACAAAAVAVGSVAASANADDGDSGGDGRTTLQFHVETSPFSYTDLGEPGPSAADVIVFHDTLFQGGREVGHEVGSCTVVEPSGLSNCSAVLTLDGQGTITYAFENAPPPEKVLAITGGSGRYRAAHGEGTFVESGQETGTLTLTVIRD
jgi:hypothetical protein